MTNSELILRLVEMLLQQKEETMKAKEEKNEDQSYTIHSRNKVEVTVYLVFYTKKVCAVTDTHT